MGTQPNVSAQKILWRRLLSIFRSVAKYAAYPLAGSVLLGCAYIFFERNMLLKHVEILQKSLDSEKNHSTIMQTQYEKQIETLKLDLATEKSHKENMQAEYDIQIQIYKLIGSKTSSAIENKFEEIRRQQTASK